MNFTLDLDKEFNFQHLYVLTPTENTVINQKLVDSMFAPGAVANEKKKSTFLVTNVTLEWV